MWWGVCQQVMEQNCYIVERFPMFPSQGDANKVSEHLSHHPIGSPVLYKIRSCVALVSKLWLISCPWCQVPCNARSLGSLWSIQDKLHDDRTENTRGREKTYYCHPGLIEKQRRAPSVKTPCSMLHLRRCQGRSRVLWHAQSFVLAPGTRACEGLGSCSACYACLHLSHWGGTRIRRNNFFLSA